MLLLVQLGCVLAIAVCYWRIAKEVRKLTPLDDDLVTGEHLTTRRRKEIVNGITKFALMAIVAGFLALMATLLLA